MTRRLLPALLLLASPVGCSAPAPLADSWDPPSEEPTPAAGTGGTAGEATTDPVPMAGEPSVGGAGSGGQPAASGGAGQGGLPQEMPTAGQGQGGKAEDPPCCSGHYNGIGQCVVDSSPACTGKPPACGDGEEYDAEGGECCSWTELNGCPSFPCQSYDRFRICHAPGGTARGCRMSRTWPLDEHGNPQAVTACSSQNAGQECELDGDVCRPL